MNTFNRVVLVLLLILAMLVCSLALIVPLGTLQTIAAQAEALAYVLGTVKSVIRVPAGILLAVIVDLVGILFVVLEVRRPAAQWISVEQAGGGDVRLSVASIAEQLKVELSQLSDVVQVKPKVSAGRKGVVVEVDARISAETGVPEKGQRIVEAITQVVADKMGLKLARSPKVNIEAVQSTSGTRRASMQPSPSPVMDSAMPDTLDEESELS
mgnify:CR=1 FL=1